MQDNGFLSAFQLATQAFAAGFPVFALHAGVTLAMLLVAVAVYVLLTPHKEFELLRTGNTAAALSLSSVIVGLALPLAVSMATSLSWADIIIWGAVTLLVQILAFRVVDVLLPDLPKRLRDNDVAAATFLAAVKLATAMVLAAAAWGGPLARV